MLSGHAAAAVGERPRYRARPRDGQPGPWGRRLRVAAQHFIVKRGRCTYIAGFANPARQGPLGRRKHRRIPWKSSFARPMAPNSGIERNLPMINFEQCRRNMVECQLRPNKVTDEGVLSAMGHVPREVFAGPLYEGIAYVDEDIPLGDGRYLMEPMVLARLLQAANIGADDVVLDIGCGSGYTAAVCARICATVVAVESDPRLAAESTRIMGELEADNVVVVDGPLKDGYQAQAPYDVIVFSGAVPEIPHGVINQLSEGGRLVAVLEGEEGWGHAVLARNVGGTISRAVIFDASIPELPGFDREVGFVF